MRHIPQMVAVMTPFPYHIAASATLTEAVAMMNEHNARHLPVFDAGDIVDIDEAKGAMAREGVVARSRAARDKRFRARRSDGFHHPDERRKRRRQGQTL